MLDTLKNKLQEKANRTAKFTFESVASLKLNDDERNSRLDTCRNCDQFHNTQFCKICGCYMPVKTYLPFAKCPINKWTSIEKE